MGEHEGCPATAKCVCIESHPHARIANCAEQWGAACHECSAGYTVTNSGAECTVAGPPVYQLVKKTPFEASKCMEIEVQGGGAIGYGNGYTYFVRQYSGFKYHRAAKSRSTAYGFSVACSLNRATYVVR